MKIKNIFKRNQKKTKLNIVYYLPVVEKCVLQKPVTSALPVILWKVFLITCKDIFQIKESYRQTMIFKNAKLHFKVHVNLEDFLSKTRIKKPKPKTCMEWSSFDYKVCSALKGIYGVSITCAKYNI